MRKNMEKNKAMRLASGLLVATLLTTSVISGVFAKYTTVADGANTARVAKWGVVASVDNNFFGEKYLIGSDPTAANTITTSMDNTGFSVATSNKGENVIAPGTKNNAFSYGITGTPEVDGVISAFISGKNFYLEGEEWSMMSLMTKAEFEALKGSGEIYSLQRGDSYDGGLRYAQDFSSTWQEGKFYKRESITNLKGLGSYYPVVFKLNGNTLGSTTVADVHKDTLAALTSSFNTDYRNTYFKAGDSLATLASLPQISWEWAFCNNPDTKCIGNTIAANGTINEACEYCKADTLIGDLMAGTIDLDRLVHSGYNGEFTSKTYYGAPYKNSEPQFGLAFDMALTITQVD